MNKEEIAFYPMSIYNLTQGYGKDSYSHKSRYPFDIIGGVAYAPFDMKVVKIESGFNTVTFQSLNKIKANNGVYDYFTLFLTHCNNIGEFKIKVDKVIKQGEACYRQGVKSKLNNITGPHIHLEVARGLTLSVNAKNCFKPEDLFYLKEKCKVMDKTYNGVTYNIPTFTSTSTPEPVVISDDFKIGDIVIVNGILYCNSNGTGKGRSVKNVKTKITRIAKKTDGTLKPKAYNTLGDLGWVAGSQLTKYEK